MNYGELKTYIRGYISRSDLADSLFDIWQDTVNGRLRRDTNIINLDRIETIANPAGDVIYPLDSADSLQMESLLSVALVGVNGGPVPLVAVSWEQLVEAQAIGSANSITRPWCYAMFSTGFKVAPGDQSAFTFECIFRAADKAMVVDTDTNNYLTFAQGLYIEAVLVEVYKYFRDLEGEAIATKRYEKESQQYKTYMAWQQSGANLSESKGAWSWD
jgi:hypothetical protein